MHLGKQTDLLGSYVQLDQFSSKVFFCLRKDFYVIDIAQINGAPPALFSPVRECLVRPTCVRFVC